MYSSYVTSHFPSFSELTVEQVNDILLEEEDETAAKTDFIKETSDLTANDELMAKILQEEEQLSSFHFQESLLEKPITKEKHDQEDYDELIARILQEEPSLFKSASQTRIDEDEKLALALARESEKNVSTSVRPRVPPLSRSLLSSLPHFSNPPSFETAVQPFYISGDDEFEDFDDSNRSDASSYQNLDTENMTYEQLLDLGEQIGNVEKGVDQGDLQQLPIHTFTNAISKENSECSICQELYVLGDKIRTLPCFHNFHQRCIDPWLKTKTSCPVCLKSVVNS